MKGSYSASPTFHPLHIRKAQIFISEPLVLWDTKRLYFDHQGISIPWENKAIINCTYSKMYSLLFLLCEDWKLYIFTENLELITKVTWDSKYTVCFKFIQQIQSLLMIGVSEVELLKVKILSNVKQTKFISSMKCDIIKNEIIIADEKTKLKWNKGYEVVTEQKLLYVWSLQDIIFYKLDTLQVIVKIQNITKKEVPLTKIFYNKFYKYIVIGYINGNIKIWKIPQKNSDKREIIHTFDYHTKAILDLLKTNDQRIFMSNGADYKIGLWNLDTFELVYNYDFTGIYENIKVINSDYFYATKQNEMGLCEFGKKLQFICNISNEVIYCDKFRETPNLFIQSSPIQSIQFTLNSNLGFNLHTSDLLKSDVNKVNISFFYPPLKSKGITQIISCPFESNKYYLLVQNGEIYKTRIEENSGKIQNLYVIEKITDQQSHQLNQQATIIKFLKILPPKYDSEIIAKVYTLQQSSNKNQSETQLEKIYQEKQLITIGCNKGAIIFLQRANFEKIYTRITYHRSQIIQIDSIYNKQTKQSYLISLCSEQLLKIVKFEDGKSICLQTINCQQNLINFKASTNKLCCIFPKGVFEIFKADTAGTLTMIENEDSYDHEQPIICIDIDEAKKIVMTAALDKKIKIWTFYKILIYQISLNQDMNQVILANDLNIIIAHNKKLSLLRKNNFSISEKQIQDWEKSFLQIDHDSYELSNYFYDLRGKKKSVDYTTTKNNNNSISLNTTFRNSISKKKRRNSARKSLEKQKEQSFVTSQLKMNNIVEQRPTNERNSKSNIHSIKPKHKQSSRKKFIDDFYRNKKKVEYEENLKQDSQVLKKHINDMTEMRKVNIECFPKIKNEKQSLFDEFMKAKLLNKKILTRRDITLNRIIMKNIIRQYIGGDIVQGLSGVKVDT